MYTPCALAVHQQYGEVLLTSLTISQFFRVLDILGEFWPKPIKDINLLYILEWIETNRIKDEVYDQKKSIFIPTVHLNGSRF